MPARSQAKIRRDINRLEQTVDRHAEGHSALGAIKPRVASAAALVNDSWQAFQAAVVVADKKRDERNTAIDTLRHWVQRWRPVETATRAAFAEATISANEVLVRGTEIVRAIFGPPLAGVQAVHRP